DRTFFIYRRHFLLFFGISAITGLAALTFNVLNLMVTASRRPVVSDGATVLMGLLYGLAALVVAICALMLAQGATVFAVSEVQLERPASISASFAAVRPMLGALIATALLAGVKIMLGVLLFVVPGILLALKYMLVIPVAVLEQRFGGDASERSSDLT